MSDIAIFYLATAFGISCSVWGIAWGFRGFLAAIYYELNTGSTKK